MTTTSGLCPFCEGALTPGAERCVYCGNEIRKMGGVPASSSRAPAASSAAAGSPQPSGSSPRLALASTVAVLLFAAGVAIWFLRIEETGESPVASRGARASRGLPPAVPPAADPAPEPVPPPAVDGRVTLVVRSIPRGAQAFLDGEPLGLTPVEVSRRPSDVARRLEVRADGFEAASATLTLDESQQVVLTLERLEAVPDEEEVYGGSLPVEAIREVVRAERSTVERCAELDQSGSEEVRIVVRLRIGTAGNVEEATVRSSRLRGTPLGTCAERAARRWRFPRASSPTETELPFVLVGRGGGGTDQPPAARQTLDRSAVRRVITASSPVLRRCYETRSAAARDRSTRVTARLVIEPTGRVSSAELSTTGLDDAGVEECMGAALRRLRFPAFDGDAVTVSYPFIFRSEGD